MIEVTLFEAEDGTRFETRQECQDYEDMLSIVNYLENSDVFKWRDVDPQDVIELLQKRYILTLKEDLKNG